MMGIINYVKCKKKKEPKIEPMRSGSFNRIITVTEKTSNSYEREEEFWIKFYVPSHELIDIADNLCDVLDYRREEIIGQDFQEIMITPIFKKYANTLINKSPKTLPKIRSPSGSMISPDSINDVISIPSRLPQSSSSTTQS